MGMRGPFNIWKSLLLFLVGADYLADHHGTVFQHRLNFVHGIFVAGMVLMLRTVLQFEIVWIDGSAEIPEITAATMDPTRTPKRASADSSAS